MSVSAVIESIDGKRAGSSGSCIAALISRLLGRGFSAWRSGFCLLRCCFRLVLQLRPAQEDVASFSHCSFSLSDPDAFVHRAVA